MSQKSVCFVSLPAYGYFKQGAGETGGGAERQIYLLSQELKDRFDISFIVGDYEQPSVEERDGVTLYRAYCPNPDASMFERFQQLAKLFQAMRRADADTYIYRGNPRKATAVYVLSSFLQAEWVYNIAIDDNVTVEIDRLPSPARKLFLRGLRDARGVIAQTEFQQNQLMERYGIDSTVVPNGYPPAENKTPLTERGGFIWVGRIEENQKRPHLFIELAEMVPNGHFRLIGPIRDEAYGRRVRRRAAEVENVTFVGPVAPEAIHQYYRDALALVNTSRSEGFPNTFLEAWRQRTPVISLDVDPGRFVPFETASGNAAGSIDELAEMAICLIENIEFRETLADQAYEEFASRFLISDVANRYQAVILN